ncbi:MAG: hypothetical protein FWE44_02725 [Defluviitaleaceae bacterium]|nr:hypothetical protein [Defluviitaleaceae bacterium]
MNKITNFVSSVNGVPPSLGDVSLTAFDIPYAYFTIDVTSTPAPPALPRARSWRVDFTGNLQGSYDYRRYFYATSGDAQADEETRAVAAWVIEGQRVFFEYIENNTVVKVSNLTDSNGNVLIESYRPILIQGQKWFFGPNRGTNAFPDADNIHSIIDLDVDAINTIIGSTFELSTNAKQIVNAINELYAIFHMQPKVLVTDLEVPDSIHGNLGDIIITPYGVYVMKFKVSTGFLATTSDPRFAGIWTDMGINEMHTISGSSSHFVDISGNFRNTNWFLHESGNYVIVWSNYNANPNTPRAGAWFINFAATPRLDSGAIATYTTPVSPQLSTSLPPSGNWGFGNIQWTNYTGSEPSEMGWVLQLKLHTTPNTEIFIDNTQMLTVPTPPATGNYRLASQNGNLVWVV